MIFWTWRSYFICWQIFENKVWCPVSKKRRRYFHFLLSLAYPIDRLDWALFSVVILFHHLFPLLEKVEIRAFILPRNFPAVLIIFMGRGGSGRGTPPSPQRGAGRPSLLKVISNGSIDFNDPKEFDDILVSLIQREFQLEVWPLIIQKSTVINSSLMVLFMLRD